MAGNCVALSVAPASLEVSDSLATRGSGRKAQLWMIAIPSRLRVVLVRMGVVNWALMCYTMTLLKEIDIYSLLMTGLRLHKQHPQLVGDWTSPGTCRHSDPMRPAVAIGIW